MMTSRVRWGRRGLEGRLTIYLPDAHKDEPIEIEIEDTASHTMFCRIELTREMFLAALGRQAMVPMTHYSGGTEYLGMQRETRRERIDCQDFLDSRGAHPDEDWTEAKRRELREWPEFQRRAAEEAGWLVDGWQVAPESSHNGHSQVCVYNSKTGRHRHPITLERYVPIAEEEG